MNGILLIAIGDVVYGHFAFNMALSLKHSNKNIPITLLTDGFASAGINQRDKWVFDKIVNVDSAHYQEKGLNPFKLKTYMYDYSPYENTLYLDVDGLFLSGQRKINDLFKLLEQWDFQIYEVRKYDKKSAEKASMVWTMTGSAHNGKQTLPQVWNEYNLKPDAVYPEYNSSFVWFKKNEANKKYFEQVKINYNDRRMKYKPIGGDYPDELAFNLASAQLNHYVAKPLWRPIHMPYDKKVRVISEQTLGAEYWFIGLAGGMIGIKLSSLYKNLTKRMGSRYNRLDIRKKYFNVRKHRNKLVK